MFKFIDLFAGIGGMRLAAEESGGVCVFTSEWDKFAQKTYAANHSGEIHGDIRSIDAKNVPDHDLLIAGFPCQPFSIAGVSKNQSLGREHGLKDEMRGTLFFEVARIIEEKRPQAFLLENVKNLLSHDKGNTFRVISEAIELLGYQLHFKVIDANAFVPQHRERIFLVGFREPKNFDWNALPMPQGGSQLSSLLEDDVDPKYTLSSRLWASLEAHKQRHQDKGGGFGCGTVSPACTRTRTLLARYYKDGSEILLEQPGKNPRRLTPRECARLMGFPDSFKLPCSDTQSYKQLGNSVVVPCVSHVIKLIIPHLELP